MSKAATILGAIIGLMVLLLSMVDYDTGRIIGAFFNAQALGVVVGGTLAAVLVNYPFSQVMCVFWGLWRVLTHEPPKADAVVEEAVELAHRVKRGGLLALERAVDEISDPFFRFAIGEALIHKDEQQLRRVLESRLNSDMLRQLVCQEVFNTMAAYAPAFGMMGTVMGLIIMMTRQGGEQAVAAFGAEQTQNMLAGLLTGMGLALVTTFYGVLLANLVFMPVAGKLKVLADAEAFKNRLVIEAVVALWHQEGPLMVKDRLLAHLDAQMAEKLEALR
ncbi:MotA/TolQ/ExbB proton channel family protein [Sulfurivirga sp.]|uniref:motility protein A n=1 Tax=Sulfurivirga sp. TaxID=2614236 RepID=UPI0025EBED10|nr:MotA/TolQ/ExbB proton channel family protein [Sulfurivirga sp.]